MGQYRKFRVQLFHPPVVRRVQYLENLREGWTKVAPIFPGAVFHQEGELVLGEDARIVGKKEIQLVAFVTVRIELVVQGAHKLCRSDIHRVLVAVAPLFKAQDKIKAVQVLVEPRQGELGMTAVFSAVIRGGNAQFGNAYAGEV